MGRKLWHPKRLIIALLLVEVALLLLWGGVGYWVQETPNLLAGNLSAWETVGRGGTVELAQAVDNPAQPVFLLSIPRSDLERWVALRRRVTVQEPAPYELTVPYRLPQVGQSQSQVVLRVEQFDATDTLINREEIADPQQLQTTFDTAGELAWHRLHHQIMVAEQATAIELSIALLGNHATRLEVAPPTLSRTPQHSGLQTGQQIVGWFAVGNLILLSMLIGRQVDFSQPRARQVRRVVGMVAVNLLIFVLFAELVALGFYFWRDGGLFYLNKRHYEPIGLREATGQLVDERAENLTSRRVHPFFGFVVQPGIDNRFNNYGLISPYDYPYLKTDERQFIIGVFGGSVAEIFAQSHNRAQFVETLQQHEAFRGQEIIVLNFAAGAYKQPQQLMVLNYFLSVGQTFDMVLNIDGFNEASMSYINYQDGVAVSMPVSYIMLPLVNLSNQTTPSPRTIESLAAINRYRATLNELASFINQNDIAGLNFVLEQYYLSLHQHYRMELTTLEQLQANSNASLIYVNRADEAAPEEVIFEKIAQNWANSSIMMNQLLRSRDIPYFHILQPNQYYSQKQFTAEEARIALNPNQISKAGVETIYPLLVEKIELLQQNEVQFYSGLNIFDDEVAAVYGDDCCHYNELGNKILVDFITQAILGQQTAAKH